MKTLDRPPCTLGDPLIADHIFLIDKTISSSRSFLEDECVAYDASDTDEAERFVYAEVVELPLSNDMNATMDIEIGDGEIKTVPCVRYRSKPDPSLPFIRLILGSIIRSLCSTFVVDIS